MTQGVGREHRHLKAHPCGVCGGGEDLPRGQGRRCTGFTSAPDSKGRTWVRCSRDELAGSLPPDDSCSPPVYRHLWGGPCNCGTTHAPAPYRADTNQIEATYDYRDESGTLLYQVVRKVGKEFRQRRPDPMAEGGWSWKLGDVRRVLYRLPELVAAPPDVTVYVVEGEKDVASLQRHLDAAHLPGVVTTNAGGAGKWPSVAALSRTVLAGRAVVVIGDADAAGRKHVPQVADAIRSVVRSLTLLEPPEPHKDVADLLAAGGALSQLVPFAAPPLRLAPPAPDLPAWLDHETPSDPALEDPRPEVRLGGDSFKNVVALDEALAANAPDVFQRSLSLVEVVSDSKPGLVAAGAPTLRALTRYSLETHIARYLRCVRWQKPDKQAISLATLTGTEAKGEWVPSRAAPDTALLPMLAFGRWTRIRPIAGVVEAPIFRPDGTIAQAPGYDPATGYLYRPAGEFPPVPEHPTQEDARLAMMSLRHVFCDFPYVSEAASYVPVAALLTILARAAIRGCVPVFAFEASRTRSGKTKQGDAVHLIATGRLGAHSPFPHDDVEQIKAMLSIALSASPVAFFDNVKGQFGGAALENAVTAGELKQRILGASEDVTVSWIATVIVTGNNMTMTEDMLGRTLLCRIEPKEEDPRKRTDFEHPDLLDWVASERPRLLVAALTILRAYAAHGFPDARTGTLQSFNAWSRVVPPAIVFAGGPNVLEAVADDASGGTDEAGALVTLIRELPRLSASPLSTKALLDAVYPAPGPNDPPDGFDELREALETLCPGQGRFPPDAKKLGYALKSRVGQVSGGRKLVATMSRTSARLWSVIPT